MAVTTEHRGAVTTIILDRVERRNAIDSPTAKALRAAFRTFERNREARVAVLWGANGTFCAGADLKAYAERRQRRPWPVYDEGPMGPTRIRLAKPAIAAIAGHAVRVVEEDAVMGVFNRRWGIPLIDGGTVRLPALVGLARALDIMMTGRPIDAREAERIGLANRVVPRGRAREEAEALARTIAEFPPHCVLSDRRSAYDSLGKTLDAALRREHALGAATMKTGESLAGAQRFAGGAGRHGSFR